MQYLQLTVLIASLVAVNATPPPGHIPKPDTDQHPPKYEYGYVVSDDEGSQGHVESRDGIYALGRYHVTLPDGSAQRVTYFADDWGYHPLVSYASSTEHGASRTEFAMGEQAVAALKHTLSPAANLISSPEPTKQTPTQSSYLISGPQEVQISSAGASGHHDQSFQTQEISTAALSTTTPVPATLSTSLPPPTAEPQLFQHSSVTYQTESTVTPTTVATDHQEARNIHQELQQQISETITKLEQESHQKVVSVTEAPQAVFTVHQYSPSVQPAQQYIATKAEQIISIVPTQQYIAQQSPLSSLLLQENPAAHSSVQIVTPTPILYEKPQETYPDESANSILTNSTDDNSFTVHGQNVQITSYLADTNKVLQFGDRLPNKDHNAEQQILDQIEKHAKLRIYQDLQKHSSGLSKPIVVAGSSPTTPQPATIASKINLINIGAYHPTASAFHHNYFETNSLSQSLAEKSDLTQIGVTGNGFYAPRAYVSINQLAPLQAGLALLTVTEKPAAPVSEESKETTKTIVDVQKGLVLDVPQDTLEVGQYQALGYERRLVDSRAQQAVNEPNPILQVIRTQDFAQQQETELRQVQESLQELQQKIVKEIDAQHEEEQRKQEVVANERQKHLESLQKVAQLLQDVKATQSPGLPSYGPEPIQDNGLYQGPQYLPPQPTGSTAVNYHNYQSSGTSYQNVAVTSTGQQIETDASTLSPPPVPPTIVELEKPVIIEKPVAIETTKLVEIEKPVLIKESVPIETTKVVQVEKAVPVYQPYPVTVTRVVTLDRPVALPTPYGVPQPVPFPYAVPHAVGVPFPQLLPYPEVLPIAFKQYHPVFIQTKSAQIKPSKRMPEQVFRDPRPELFQYSHSYHTIPLHMKATPHKASHYRHYASKAYSMPSGRNRNYLKNLRIEYGGFKPPLIPSTELTEEPKPSPYGPSVKEE